METEALERPADLTIWRTAPATAPLAQPERYRTLREAIAAAAGALAVDHHRRGRDPLAELDPHLPELTIDHPENGDTGDGGAQPRPGAPRAQSAASDWRKPSIPTWSGLIACSARRAASSGCSASIRTEVRSGLL